MSSGLAGVLHPAQRTLVPLVAHPAAGADHVLLLAHEDGDLGGVQTHRALQVTLLLLDELLLLLNGFRKDFQNPVVRC